MKKLSCLFGCLAVFTGFSVAQKPHIGISLGNTISSYKIHVESESVTSKPRIGYTAGIFADVPVSPQLSIMPALNFVQKGGRLKSDGIKHILITNYVEMPLNVVYKIRSKSGSFVMGGGGALSAGVGGNGKWEIEGETGSDKVKFGTGYDDDYKPLETSINFIAGYFANDGFILTANYNIGLSNLINDTDDFDTSFRNRYFGVKMGYIISN